MRESVEKLIELSDRIQRVLVGIEGQADISSDQITGQPTLQVRLKPDRLAQLGIAADEILPFVESIGVLRVGEIYEGQRQFPLAVTLPEEFKRDPDAIRNLLIPTESDIQVPLGEVADVVETSGAAEVSSITGALVEQAHTKTKSHLSRERMRGRRARREPCSISGILRLECLLHANTRGLCAPRSRCW